MPSTAALAPPPFVRLAAHPVRWQLLVALAESDHRVRELVARLGQPQNLVSYHLRLLRAGGLVRARRSSYDGRDSYYHLDLARCAEALGETAAALHPALRAPGAADRAAERPPSRHPAVLFVCTGNSARSPLAEALLRRRAGDRVTALSAGTQPKPRLHPATVRVLADGYGIDVGDQRPRGLGTLAGRRFDHVITLCDRAREACPDFPERPRRRHWSIADPAGEASPADAFSRTAADIDRRIRHLLPVLDPPEEVPRD